MNIDKMPVGREMDALVAEKVMGLVIQHKPGGMGGGTVGSSGNSYYYLCRYCHAVMPGGMLVGTCPEAMPYYSTDIAAAWQVVEKLSANPAEIELFLYSAKQWECGLFTYPDYFRGEADTAPLAICRAALNLC